MQTLKSLLVTALILGGLLLAYDRYLAPDSEKLVFKPETPPPVQRKPLSPEKEKASVHEMKKDAVKEVPEVKIVKEEPPEPPGKEPETAAPAAAADAFVPPAIASLEEATANWRRIPASAFPRQVRLKQAAVFKGSFGSTKVSAGAEVTATGAEAGMLTLAPTATSTLRGSVPLEATDLKERLGVVYEAWRVRRLADARAAWEQRRHGATLAAAVPESASEAAVAPDGRPQRSADGSFPLLLASMRSGAVTDIKPDTIKQWGDVQAGTFRGKPCWNVHLEYEAPTIFGKMTVEAVARVVEGKVAGWYYTGSGEPVP